MTFRLLAVVIGAAASCWLTAMMRRYALSYQLLDLPNERSSHVTPTPRGGGIGIVLSFLAILAVFGYVGQVAPEFCIALFGAGGFTATLGFIDDRHHVPAAWRLLGHIAAAVWALAWLGRLPPVPVLGYPLDLGIVTSALAALFIVWSVNLVNFMDGIDGIAGIETVSVTLGGALVWWLVAPAGDWPAALLLSACAAGFLIWNFPPARIFMGDVGSGFLGLTIAVLALRAGQSAPQLFWAWFILFGCFMVDATTTLIRRTRRGEKFHQAHRNHAFQYAARRFGSHRRVTLAVAAINTLWLLPFAVAVALKRIDGVLAMAIAYAPLIALVLAFKAGDRAAQEV